jgi:hypothetical protein
MKTKTLSLILGMILLVGIVTAGTITNVLPVNLEIPSFIAGGKTSTTFSFDYPDVEDNYNNAPLVARVNLTSLDEEYPVWKGDFIMGMVANQYFLPTIFGEIFPINTIPMTCSENSTLSFKAKDKSAIQYIVNNIPNGTFYCYNPNYYMLQLDSNDKINLSISSNSALYPGEYSVSVELLEMEPDVNSPEIKLILDEPLIYSEEDKIHVQFNVTDMYEIRTVEYKITNPDLDSYYNSGWIEVQLNEETGLYEDYFDFSEYGLSTSGSYWIFARACDVLGNCREM